MERISIKELELIETLRMRVTDVVPEERLQDDHFMVRWLRARDLDLVKAEVMLRKSMAWHQRNETDRLLSWKSPKNFVPYAMLGHDSEGCPVLLFPMGMWDMAEAVVAGDIVPSFRSLLRMLVVLENEMKLATQRFKKPVNQVVLIFDFDDFEYLKHLNCQPAVQGAIEFFKIFEANCPEAIKIALVLNTGKLFQMGFAILKPFMSGRTVSKMEIYGSQKQKWMNALHKKVSVDILPPYYGGKLAGCDEFCSDSKIWNNAESTLINYRGIVPNRRRRGSLFDRGLVVGESIGDWKQEEIPPGSKLEMDFLVTQDLIDSGRQMLKWKVMSEQYDLAFQVTFTAEGQTSSIDVIKCHQVDSHVKPHEGSLVVDKAGIYSVTLNNSHSRFRKKTVFYNVNLTQTPSLVVSTNMKIPSFRA